MGDVDIIIVIIHLFQYNKQAFPCKAIVQSYNQDMNTTNSSA